MLKIGDIVRRMPSVHIGDNGWKIGGTVKGEVVYIHPKGHSGSADPGAAEGGKAKQ